MQNYLNKTSYIDNKNRVKKSFFGDFDIKFSPGINSNGLPSMVNTDNGLFSTFNVLNIIHIYDSTVFDLALGSHDMKQYKPFIGSDAERFIKAYDVFAGFVRTALLYTGVLDLLEQRLSNINHTRDYITDPWKLFLIELLSNLYYDDNNNGLGVSITELISVKNEKNKNIYGNLNLDVKYRNRFIKLPFIKESFSYCDSDEKTSEVYCNKLARVKWILTNRGMADVVDIFFGNDIPVARCKKSIKYCYDRLFNPVSVFYECFINQYRLPRTITSRSLMDSIRCFPDFKSPTFNSLAPTIIFKSIIFSMIESILNKYIPDCGTETSFFARIEPDTLAEYINNYVCQQHNSNGGVPFLILICSKIYSCFAGFDNYLLNINKYELLCKTLYQYFKQFNRLNYAVIIFHNEIHGLVDTCSITSSDGTIFIQQFEIIKNHQVYLSYVDEHYRVYTLTEGNYISNTIIIIDRQ